VTEFTLQHSIFRGATQPPNRSTSATARNTTAWSCWCYRAKAGGSCRRWWRQQRLTKWPLH